MITVAGRHGGRELFLARIADVAEWPASLERPERHFVALLAFDARGVPDQTILDFARTLVAQGAVYVCAWGPDCERVHDLFDRALAERLPEWSDDLLMTTWHADETLEEALWFALFSACPDDGYAATCDAVVAIAVGNEDWARVLERRLAEPDTLVPDAGR